MNKKLTIKQKYLEAGFKLMPGGSINDYAWQKYLGRLGSMKQDSWVKSKENPHYGRHTCCGSKRDYYHKLNCKGAGYVPDDLSDLKDLEDIQ